jgi:hypothetical protein
MQVEENQGYILRVSHDDWVEQIFEIGKYYSGARALGGHRGYNT